MKGDIKHSVEEFPNCPMLKPGALETHLGGWSWGCNEGLTDLSIRICSDREHGLAADIWDVPPAIGDMIRTHAKNAVDKRLREIQWVLGI